MSAERLLKLYERIADAPDAIPQLRQTILNLAVRGKLVPQDPNDEPASELLKRIAKEKTLLVKAGEIRDPKPRPGNGTAVFPLKLPAGWTLTRLAAISRRIHYGYTASSNAALKDIRMLRITDIQNNSVDWSSVPGCVIEPDKINHYKLNNGDILVARTGGTVGKTFLVSDVSVTAIFASYLIRIQGTGQIFDKYLKLFLESPLYWTQLLQGARGTGQPNVNSQTLGKLALPLAPLSEQHRIVAKVDELMALCDQLEAARAEREATRDRLTAASLARLNTPDPKTFRNDARFALGALPALTTRPDQIKQLRQTILNLAVRGKLVPQDPNDEPASELLKRIAVEKMRLGIKHGTSLPRHEEIAFELPSGWSWSCIGEVCSKTGSGSTPRGGQAIYKKIGIPFLRSQNVYNDGLRLDEVAYIDASTHARMARTAVKSKDLLLNITGGSIGRCCRVPDTFGEANVSQHVAIIRVALPGLEDFLHLLVLSPYFQTFIFDKQTGAGRGGLPKNRMDRIGVALPPLAEQHRIVSKVNELMALCDQLEAQLATSDTESRRLLDAVLHEALSPKPKAAVCNTIENATTNTEASEAA